MAISVRDIQEKEFSTQATGGYDIDQVDDFLDEIAEQMSALVRENLELNQQIKNPGGPQGGGRGRGQDPRLQREGLLPESAERHARIADRCAAHRR